MLGATPLELVVRYAIAKGYKKTSRTTPQNEECRSYLMNASKKPMDVVILRSADLPPLDLHPFIQWCECPQCHHERVLVMNDERKYLDPQIGHRVVLVNPRKCL